jgi:hypothetical protein
MFVQEMILASSLDNKYSGVVYEPNWSRNRKGYL